MEGGRGKKKKFPKVVLPWAPVKNPSSLIVLDQDL